MTPRRTEPLALAAAAAAAVGAWCASGAIAPASGGGAARVGVLAPWWLLFGLLAAALAAAYARRLTGRDAAPLWLPLIAVLPWLPLPLMPAALIWVGPPGQWLAVAAVVAVVAGSAGRSWRVAGAGVRSWLAVVALTSLFAASAWWIAPRIPGGDEPHYLVITQSLLHDADLRIEDNHRRREYAAYVEGELRPDYLRRGRDGAIYSIHAPGVSALVLPAFALGGYPGVVLLLAALSAAGLVVVWHSARVIARGSAAAASVAAMAVGLSVPFFFQTMTVYPDGPAAVAVAVVFWLAVIRPRGVTWQAALACGLLLGALPWLHTRYAAIAGPLGLVVAARAIWPAAPEAVPPRSRVRAFAALLLPAIASAACWFAMFQAIYGTWDPRAPYGHATDMRVARIPHGIAGLLLDQQFGLLPNAPIYLLALAGLLPLWRRQRRLVLELAVATTPYLLAVAGFHMWWGGRSSPARFLVPVLLPLALPIASWWADRSSRTARAAALGLLGVSLSLTAALVIVDHGRLLYNSRDGHALWLLAASAPVNLTYALPSLFQTGPAAAWMRAAAWLAPAAAAVALLRWLESRLGPSTWPAAVVGSAVLVVLAGSTIGWALSGRAALDPGPAWLGVVAHGCAGQAHSLTTRPMRLAPARTALTGVSIGDASRRPRRPDGALWSAADLPPGRYAVTVGSGLNVSGSLAVAFGRPDTILTRCLLDEHPPGRTSCEIDLPAGAAALWITGDATIARTAESISLAVVEMGDAGECGTRAARAAVREGRPLFVIGGQAWVEGTGLWTRGGGRVSAMAPAAGGRAGLCIRQGGAGGVVRVRSGSWTESRAVDPGATWELDVPARAGARAVRVVVETEAGFRPSEANPPASDTRLLGAWVEPR